MIAHLQRQVDDLHRRINRHADRRLRTPRPKQDVFPAEIDGNAALGSHPKRWKYAWTEVALSGDDDATLTGARSGTTSSDYALNLVEANNPTGSGVNGNSVDDSGTDYPAGFSLQPVATNTLVWMHEIIDSNGDRRYWFQYENADDGTCEAS